MPRLSLLAACASLAALAACASPSGSGQPTDVAGDGGAAAPVVSSHASPLGLYLAGQAALGEGKGDVAASYFAQAAHEDSDAAFLKDSAFQAALFSGDVRRAAQLAPATGEGSAGAVELGQLTRAVEDLAEDRGREAQALLGGHPLTPPLDIAGKLLSPWTAAAAGDWKTALAAPDNGGDHLVGQIALLDQALLLENRHETDEADQAFRKLLAISDGAGLYTAAYGEFLERHGRTPAAISLFQAGLKTEPSNALLQDALTSAQAGHAPPRAPTLQQGAANALLPPAAFLLAEKQPELGLDYLRLALRLDPKRDEAWLLIGDTLSAGGQVDEAREAYAEPQPGSSAYVPARSRLIATYDDSAKDAPTELALAEATAKAAPSDPDAMELLADALRINSHYQESAQVLDKLIAQLGPQASWSLYYMRGVALDQAGDWPGAERDLKQALAMSPDEPDVLNYLGYSWIDRGVDLKDAKTMIEKAVAAKPDSGAIVDSLGWADYKLGLYTDAVEQLERATELEPADPDINNHLGDAYWAVGRKLEARFQWEQVLSLGPSDKLRAEVEAKLKEGPDAGPRPAIAEK
jgi:tetratricopeptide (TPR) repeat protein